MVAQKPLNSIHYNKASERKLLWHSLASIFDQAWLSALNLCLGLIFIRLTSTVDYGIYSQLFAAGVFSVVIAEALLINPLTTLAAPKIAQRKAAIIGKINQLHLKLSLGLALSFGIGAYSALLHTNIDHPSALAFVFSIYVFTSTRREFQRSVSFIESKPGTVLRTDLSYGIVLALIIGILVLGQQVTLTTMLIGMSLANLWPLWKGPRLPSNKISVRIQRHYTMQMWLRGRLGLPGAVSSWVVNYSYLYIVAAWLGASAAAELNASRLLLMPITLLVVAWSRVSRPMLSRLIAEHNRKSLTRLVWLSICALELATLLYVAILWPLLPWIEHHIFSTDYGGMKTLVLWWALYFVLYSLRWAGSALLLSADNYQVLLIISLTSLGALPIFLPLGLRNFGSAGAIGALICVEFFTLTAIWLFFIPITLNRIQHAGKQQGS